jgi:hypothetical protein
MVISGMKAPPYRRVTLLSDEDVHYLEAGFSKVATGCLAEICYLIEDVIFKRRKHRLTRSEYSDTSLGGAMSYKECYVNFNKCQRPSPTPPVTSSSRPLPHEKLPERPAFHIDLSLID